jgi:hypothetical protein
VEFRKLGTWSWADAPRVAGRVGARESNGFLSMQSTRSLLLLLKVNQQC